MSITRVMRLIALFAIFGMFLTPVAHAEIKPSDLTDGTTSPPTHQGTSPNLIVELQSAPLAVAYLSEVKAAAVNGKLDANSTAAQAYINQLQAEQAVFVSNMQAALNDAAVATFINEAGMAEQATYQVVFNGLAVNPGSTAREKAMRILAKLPDVKRVYYDTPHYTQLYTSTALINTPVLWNAVGGRSKAGAGVKFASMDGGVHHLAAMMNGTGYSYPAGYGPNGLGLTANNNGKIIASRAYFRPWDPPAPGDENPWPGVNGTSHGMHTASTAAGDVVTATYNGFNVGLMSGVAPKAYVMSYRVFYESVNHDGSFYNTEGIAALEDIVRDGADVINNSWGGGPSSSGGKFDALDQALINATKAGIFVSMSNGNSGPNLGTSDHPSSDYINVAASTTGGTLAVGSVLVPSAPSLAPMAFGSANFGAPLPGNAQVTYPYLPATVVDPANVQGCTAFPAGAFTGKAALINRGNCDFSLKVFNAQNAGATFVVIYNHATGGDDIQNMGAGSNAGSVTISSIFIGKTNGDRLISHYNTAGEADAVIQVDTKTTFQAGSKPDRIIGFSSRGPGVGGTLKPDIAAPGVNILAQGFTDGVTGEAQHLGYGQASGTSMAAPHVAGAAALLQQIHPDWSPATIKSALMSTAKYMNVYLVDGRTPAQPLDMGSGRLDLSKAADPGVILDPPSLSFGFVPTGTQTTLTVTVRSVATAAETYNLSTLYTANGFGPTQTTTLPGVTLSTNALTLNPGETKSFQATFNPAAARPNYGDKQGFVILDGTTHDAHLAAWARVVPALPLADVLLIDGDFSTAGPNFGFAMPDYRWYYTDALDQLGYTYSVLDYDLAALPNAATLSGYRAVIYFTGDNYVSGAGLSDADMDKLVEYTNAGGTVIVMGQDMASATDHSKTDLDNAHFFYASRLGANWIQDSISKNMPPASIIDAASTAPAFLTNVKVDLTQPRQLSASGVLTGAQEVPPASNLVQGDFAIVHNLDRNYTEFSLTVTPSSTQPITITGMHIHTGAVGVNGGVIRNLAQLGDLTLPLLVTDTLSVSGVISPSFTITELNQFANDGLYINVHTTVNTNGAIRGQIKPVVMDNQLYVDELDNHPHDKMDSPIPGEQEYPSIPLLTYEGPYNMYNGTVALGYRAQPSLENPGISYNGRTVYASFGLEGMNNRFNSTLEITPTTRSELLGAFLDWSWAPAATTVQISDTVASNSSNHIFGAQAAYGLQQRSGTVFSPTPVQYRWDFGDGSPYIISSGEQTSHQYLCSTQSTYTVRVEITDNYGNVVIGTKDIDVSKSCATNAGPTTTFYLPLILK